MKMARQGSTVLATTEDIEHVPRQRRRAPRRTGGHRAQLTVPEDMWRQITDIAQAAGTTPNDALVRIAAEYLEDRKRALALQQRAEERWEAFVGATTTTDGPSAPLSEEELVELSGAFREDG
jgi:hypothetical protein